MVSYLKEKHARKLNSRYLHRLARGNLASSVWGQTSLWRHPARLPLKRLQLKRPQLEMLQLRRLQPKRQQWRLATLAEPFAGEASEKLT